MPKDFGKLIMSSSDKPEGQLSALIKEVGIELELDYHEKFAELLYNLGLLEFDNDGPVPLEVWAGIAQAVADASGCRVILQAHIIEPNGEDPNSGRIVGYREVAVGVPFCSIKT